MSRLRTHTCRAVIAAITILGCKKAQAPEPDVYRYRIVLHNPGKNPDDPDLVSLGGGEPRFSIGGEKLVAKDGEVLVPKATLLTDPKTRLGVLMSDTCGEHAQAVRNMPAYDTARSETGARDEARRYDHAIAWKVIFDPAYQEPKPTGLYIDNSDEKTAATIRIGQTELTVPANATASEGALVGRCPNADEVSVNGTVVGKLSDLKGLIGLVDVGGGHCYLVQHTAYGADKPSAHPRDDLASYGGVAGVRLIGVPHVDNPFVANAASTTVKIHDTDIGRASAGKTLSSLTRMACGRKPK